MEHKERRRGPRYPFIASAELIEQKADVRIASRISELSMNGCYLDMMNPFPTGTIVVVKISAGKDFFPIQRKNRLFTNEHGRGRIFSGNRETLANCAGTLDRGSEKRCAKARVTFLLVICVTALSLASSQSSRKKSFEN